MRSFVMLFGTKVGRYTDEEFDSALAQFTATGKPLIFTYFKGGQIDPRKASRDDLRSLMAFPGQARRTEVLRGEIREH